MTTQRDLDRMVETFLRDGPTELPDPSFDAVRDRTEGTRQRAYLGPWRVPDMNKLVPIGLTAAAAVIALVVGSRLLGAPPPGPGGPVASPSPSPSPSASVPASPSASPDGLALGPFTNPERFGAPAVTLTIPAPGWRYLAEFGAFDKNNQSDPPAGAGLIGPVVAPIWVYGDPCAWSTTLPETPATTVDEFITAISGHPERRPTAPVDIEVDGHTGKMITIHVPDDVNDAECDAGNYASWAAGETPTTSGPDRWHQGPGQIDELWVLDVDGLLVVFDGMYGPETPQEHIDELRAMLQSITFGV